MWSSYSWSLGGFYFPTSVTVMSLQNDPPITTALCQCHPTPLSDATVAPFQHSEAFSLVNTSFWLSGLGCSRLHFLRSHIIVFWNSPQSFRHRSYFFVIDISDDSQTNYQDFSKEFIVIWYVCLIQLEFFCVCLSFLTASHSVVKSGLELCMKERIALISQQSPCLSLPRVSLSCLALYSSFKCGGNDRLKETRITF